MSVAEAAVTTAAPALRRAWRWRLEPELPARLFRPLFGLFVFITVFLPSGTLYGVNFKLPLYAVLLALAAVLLLQQRWTVGYLLRLVGLPGVLAVWIGVGLVHGFDPAGILRQYADLVLTFLLCWLAALYTRGDERQSFALLRVVLVSEIATSLLKAALIGYALVRGIPVVTVVTAVSEAFGVNLMTMDLGALFGRVQFVSDALIPLCLFVVLRYRVRLGYGGWRAAATVVLLVASVVFSFSRYFWMFSALGLVAGLLLGKRDRFQMGVVLVLGLAVLASLPVLATLYELRFSDQVAGSSDLERVEQKDALEQFFLDAPVMGHGLGSYTNQVLRNESAEATTRYSYEMQILALAGQVGLVGLALLLALVGWYFGALWTNRRQRGADRAGVLMLLLCWFAAGLYNPLLLNPVAGVSYITFEALGQLRTERDR